MLNTVEHLLHRMHTLGATRFYVKKLSPNDNSKNQVYLGGHFSVLHVLPHGPIASDAQATPNSKRERAKASLRWYWMTEHACELAPNTQLVLYPKYPEVRLSGFLTGCRIAPKEVMTVRDEGRLLFFGIAQDGRILAFACAANTPIAREIDSKTLSPHVGVLIELFVQGQDNSRAQLLEALARVHSMRWIASQKLGQDGTAKPYIARNGGGYTLEAELGIAPNGHAEPDYLGWEVKQFAVNDFERFTPKSPVTLFTPEPTAGLYKQQGIVEFMRRFSYADKSGKADRVNFGGIYKAGHPADHNTGLRLALVGFDASTRHITDFANGGIVLLSQQDEVAAQWEFASLLEHWNRKHAKAVYVPALFQAEPPMYHYGPQVLLCEGTDFSMFLQGIAMGHIYYDPAIKIEGSPLEAGKVKRRSQFRTKHCHLNGLYTMAEWVELNTN